MSVKLKIAEPGGIYFITITCFKWLPLFNIAGSYDAVYKWFQYLKRTFPVDNIMDIRLIWAKGYNVYEDAESPAEDSVEKERCLK